MSDFADVICPPRREGDNRPLTGPTIVLVPIGKSAFPMWPPHGAYVQGYNEQDSIRLAERELRLLHAHVIQRLSLDKYIYWKVARVAHLQNGSNGRGR